VAIKPSDAAAKTASCGSRLAWFQPAPVAAACVVCTACAARSKFEVETAPALFCGDDGRPILELTTERQDILDQVSTPYSEAGYSNNTNCFRPGGSEPRGWPSPTAIRSRQSNAFNDEDVHIVVLRYMHTHE
jgi:hypothetical protein